MKIWFNGKIIEQKAAAISVEDRGYLIGDGVFETLKVIGRDAKFLNLHLARLQKSCAAFALPAGCDAFNWAKIISDICAENGLEDCVVRLTVSRTGTGRGLSIPKSQSVNISLIPAPLRPAPKSLKLGVAEWRKSRHALSSCHKTLNYGDAVIAHEAAVQDGCDAALVLDTLGVVTGLTHANVFWMKDGQLFTPALTGAVLPGIARHNILHNRSDGIESRARLDVLLGADHIYASNAIWGTVPVTRVQTTRTGSFEFNPGPNLITF